MNSLTRRSALMTGAAAFALGGSNLETFAQQPKKGGTLNFAISAETPHYDNHGSDTFATLHFAAPFYNTLLRFNLSKFPEIEADLADKWEVAPDLMTYTFKLHPGVKFHDGSDLTSADVKATYDRLRDPPQGVVSTRKATFSDIGTIETPDPLTVIFKMKAVNASMLEHFASPWNVIYSAKDLAADPNGPKTKVNGTGPYTFTEHIKGGHVSGKRNENYFKKGLPLSRWIPRRVHAAGSRHAQCAARRAGARGIPRHFAGGARSPRAGDGRSDSHRGVELDAEPSRLLQHREEAVRRRARAQGAAHGDRSLGWQSGPLPHLDPALGRRRDPSGIAV